MNREEVTAFVANDILNNLNLSQIVTILRESAIKQADAYYSSLKEDDLKELEQRISEAAEEMKKNVEQAEAKEQDEKPVASNV